ncbi:MAG: OadG family protein [Sulfurimonas sp.]|nr:OadG family protein [Sulfurimonas sp.]
MEENLIIEGFKFMGLGMGTVFLFLAVLILMINLMSVITHKFFPEPKANNTNTANAKQDNKKVIAAISAAITHHKQS